MREWRDIKGYEGLYKIADNGEVLSLRTGRKLTSKVDSRGRIQANLTKDKITKMPLVHRLVAQAFIPNPLNKPQINHIDGNPKNNNVNNLEWSTVSENMVHAVQTGLFRTKLSIQQVKEIKLLVKEDLTHREIAEYYGVSRPVITRIANGKIWSHIN